MRKLLFVVLLILPSVVFSQQPFRYDTIRVSNDDTRNIHHKQQHTLRQRNQKRLRSSQSNTKSQFDARNLRYGLNLGLNFSNDYTFFRIAPQLGYQFNKYFMAGAGVSYYYSKRKYYYSNESRHNNSLGANLFGYIYILLVFWLYRYNPRLIIFGIAIGKGQQLHTKKMSWCLQ